jgi:hypothetical protein
MADQIKDLEWHNVDEKNLRGLGWKDEHRTSPFHRLPKTLQSEIPSQLWDLGCESAGLYIDFVSNATDICVRWEVKKSQECHLYMSYMGRSGLDLFGRDGSGKWRWAGSISANDDKKFNGQLNSEPLDGCTREYRLYLPLMRQVQSIEIGTRGSLDFCKPIERKPIAYYGTSIVHGAGVSRPGLSHCSQLGQCLDREFINLGFSGRAFCELPIATALGRLDPCLYIVDVLPNNSAPQLLERLPQFLELLRKSRPKTPILILGDRVFPNSTFQPLLGDTFRTKNHTLEMIVQQLIDHGKKRLHLHLHPDWFGPNGSSDGSHPNDLGATRMAEALVPIIRNIIG